VTVDAMGRQKEIAAKIIAGGGDYVLAVKDNQPQLHEDIDACFTAGLETCSGSEVAISRTDHSPPS
jgi:predicted transposase YbfD/YdcC